MFWSENIVRRLFEFVSDVEYYSESDLASALSEEFSIVVSRDAVHNKIRRLNLRSYVGKPITDIMPYYSKYRSIIESNVVVDKVFDFDGSSFVAKVDGKRLKILYLGDLHIPFQVDEQIQKAINRNMTADMLVTSEVCDCYSISRFNKNISVPFEVETDNIVRYFEYISSTFPLIFVLSGNHDDRVSKTIQKAIPPSLLFLVEENFLEMLARPFPNIIIVSGNMFQMNDTMFTHAESMTATDMKTAVGVYYTLNEWKKVLNLNDYRCVIQAHTHMLGCTYRGSNFKIMEGGCLCHVPDYSVQRFYHKPQTNGYIVVNQIDGKTDFDLTREYYFDSPLYMPKYNPVDR